MYAATTRDKANAADGLFSEASKEKAMDESSIAFFDPNFVYEKTETKKAMGAWKPPMAFAFQFK